MIHTTKWMTWKHHLKNASRDVILRLLETGLNSFLVGKNRREIKSLPFLFSM